MYRRKLVPKAKAAWRGGRLMNHLCHHKYHNHLQLSSKSKKNILSKSRRVGARPANRKVSNDKAKKARPPP
ncbi:MAG: hypothetical protein GY774_10020 [Planctomycetes bacterium]|nr:hypothetical protein [Planctomycetota bacterium]